MLSNLIVTAMVATAESILSVADRPDGEKQIVEQARTQLRMVLVGALNWRSKPLSPGAGRASASRTDGQVADRGVARQVEDVEDRVGDGLGPDPVGGVGLALLAVHLLPASRWRVRPG